MNETQRTAPPDDALVETAERVLRFQYRSFLTINLFLLACVGVYLGAYGSLWSEGAMAATGWVIGLGIPWLGWHLRVPYAARIAAPIFQLTGLALNGQDPRGNLWSLADLPILFLLAGWGIDICLRQRGKIRSTVGRIVFSLFWIYLGQRTFVAGGNHPMTWFDLTGSLLGVVAVWLPRGALLPPSLRVSSTAGEMVKRGLFAAGGWIATRIGIAILILLPSVVYLDLLDLPPLLRSEWEKSAPQSNAADGVTPDRHLLYWKREARGLTSEDFSSLEIYAAAPEVVGEIASVIQTLRKDPRNEAAVKLFEPYSKDRLSELSDLEGRLENAPIFYIDRVGSGDDRVTSGFFSAQGKRWAKWAEVVRLTEADIEHHETNVGRSTLIILAGSVLILLLLGGPSGGVPAAWWMAIFLAGVHIGWVQDSLDLIIERMRFVIWRDYSTHPAGATLFGIHSLLLFLVGTAEWLTSHLVTHAGFWVALCWPVRPGPLIRSRLDAFWLQSAKIVLIAALLYWLRFGFFMLGTYTSVAWSFAWFVIFPPLMLFTGVWMRRRITGRLQIGQISGPVRKLPIVGLAAAVAFLLRGWVPLLSNLESQGNFSEVISQGFGNAAVFFALAAAIILIIALERGTFLSPPHVEGQLWLIGAAAIPFVENVVSDPVFDLIEESNLFLGTTVGWLAFGAAIWVIGPIFTMIGDFLSHWRAKGLDRIAEFDSTLIELARSTPDHGHDGTFARIGELFSDLKIKNPQLWSHLGDGWFRATYPNYIGEQVKLASGSLAAALGEIEGSIRLEEMRLEWRWAAYHGELDRWFAEGGDLLLIPVTRDGELMGLFSAPDLAENRFLLRPAVSSAFGSSLGAAALICASHQHQAVGVVPAPSV